MTRFSAFRKILLVPFLVGVVFGVGGTVFGATMMGSAKFSDVPAGSYFDGAVGRLADAGIIQGVGNGQFGTDRFVTRQDLAVIIDRVMNGVEEPEENDSGSEGTASSRAVRKSSSSKSKSSVSGDPVVESAGKFQFSATTFNVGIATSQATIVVQRVGGKTGEVKVKYVFGGGTAVQGTDFQESSGTLTFANDETSKNIKVTILHPGAPPAKTLEVTLSEPSGGAGLGTNYKATLNLLATGTAAGSSSSSSSVSSVAGAGALSFSAETYSVDEKAGTMTITVLRTGGSTGAVGVAYATSNGTATSGTHYGAAQGTLAFAAGETSKTFTIGVTDNAVIDGNKTINITLSSPTGGVGILSNKSILTISDDETFAPSATGALLFSQSVYTVLESAKIAKVTVQRQGGFASTVSVNYATTDGTAIAALDYTAATGTLTFAPGETSKSFYVTIAQDTGVENEETINLSLNTITGPASFGERQTGTIKIQ